MTALLKSKSICPNILLPLHIFHTGIECFGVRMMFQYHPWCQNKNSMQGACYTDVPFISPYALYIAYSLCIDKCRHENTHKTQTRAPGCRTAAEYWDHCAQTEWAWLETCFPFSHFYVTHYSQWDVHLNVTYNLPQLLAKTTLLCAKVFQPKWEYSQFFPHKRLLPIQ